MRPCASHKTVALPQKSRTSQEHRDSTTTGDSPESSGSDCLESKKGLTPPSWSETASDVVQKGLQSGLATGSTERASGFEGPGNIMGFEKFGQAGYISQTKVTPLVSYLEKGVVAGTRCKNCRRLYFPPRADCLDCRRSEVEWVPLDGKARLVTFTRVFFGPPAFEQSIPYTLGLAELDNGLRVFAPISHDLDLSELRPDLGLVLKARQAGGGVIYQLEKPE